MSDSFKAAVAEVKLAYNISDYIQLSGVQLKQTGLKFKGLCPFHNERTPSFTVDDNFQSFNCFGCGARGDLINFVMKTENLEFFDSLKKLAEDKGIEIDLGDEKKDGVDYKSLRACLREAANYYVKEFRSLSDDHVAKLEITNRKLTIKNMVYGYAPERRKALFTHLESKGFTAETMVQAGVAASWENDKGETNYGDFWNGRLMFIITDVTGKPIGFSGRKLYENDKRGKYVNSPDRPLFDKSTALFNLSYAKKVAAEQKKIYVNEGQFDVASLVEVGAVNAVASSGTAFTEKQGMVLRRLVTENGKIVFCFDPDTAGIAAAVKVFQNIPAIHSQAEVVVIPEGLDPDEYRQKHGNEALLSALNNSVSIVQFVLDQEAKKYELDDTSSSLQYVQSAAKVLRTITNTVLREQYVRYVALEGLVGIEDVRSAVADAQPLHSTNPTTVEEEQAEIELLSERYTVEEQDDSEMDNEKLFELIDNSERYGLAARLTALSFRNKRYLRRMQEIKEAIPAEFYLTLNEFGKTPKGAPIIAEKFTNVGLVELLSTSNYFPLQHVMDDDTRDYHFEYLATRLLNYEKAARAKKVRRDTLKRLGKTTSMSAEFLEKAVAYEESKLQGEDSTSNDNTDEGV